MPQRHRGGERASSCVGLVEAELGEHRGRVLSKVRHGAHRGPGTTKNKGIADRRNSPRWRADVSDEPIVIELWVPHDVREVVDVAARNARPAQSLEPGRGLSSGERFFENRLELTAMSGAAFVGRVSLVLEQITAFEHLEAKRLPVLAGQDGDAEEASVSTWIRPVRAEERMAHPRAGGHFAAVPPEMGEVAQPIDHDIEQRDRDAGALSRLRAADERSEG